MTTRRIPRMRVHPSHLPDDGFGYLGHLLVDGERIYATGGSYHQPTLLVSDDGAQSWRRLAHPKTPGLRRLSRVGDTLYVVGEFGMLAASVDSGLTWVRIPVDTVQCLFDQLVAPDGTWWLAGDGGALFRSSDGISYAQVETGDWDTRLLSLHVIAGEVHVFGYDGTIRKWDGTALVPLSLDAGSPLTDVAITRAGTWVVIGDHGTIYRSTDAGETFDSVETDFDADLEAILEIPQGLLVVGNEGLVLFSDDDGQTWTKVPTDLTYHLWSIVKFGDGYVISGDDGAIWTLEVSATETMEVSLEAEEEDEDEDEDEDEEEDDDEEEIVPATFASVEEASKRWIAEGTTFINGLNAYVRRVYAVGPNKAGHEPTETRQNMADYVREQLVSLNAAGQHRKARQLFPPAYEPFDYRSLGQEIDRLMYLRDGRRIAQVGGSVYELGVDRITEIDDVDLVGRSPDRRYVVKGHDEQLDICDGWDGRIACTLPRGPALESTKSITVAPEGDAVLAATETGIYWITATAAQRLLPDDDSECGSYPHAALSPNGRFVAMGTQSTSHIVIDRKTGRRFTYNPVSSYPHFAAFHDDRPDVLLNSCHALYGSGSMCVDLDRMVTGKKNTGRILDRRAWVYAVGSARFGYLLGDRSGYIWALDFAGNQQWYAFLGSTMTAMDVSPDGKRVLAGSFAGIVVELDLDAKTPDPRLLTDGPVKDVARWLFWRGHDPMIW